MHVYVCVYVYYKCIHTCPFMFCIYLCSFTFCYTGFRFIFSFLFCLFNWYCRTSAHVLLLVWQHCVPGSPHKQRLSGFWCWSVWCYTTWAGLAVVTCICFSSFTLYHWFAFVLFEVLETLFRSSENTVLLWKLLANIIMNWTHVSDFCEKSDTAHTSVWCPGDPSCKNTLQIFISSVSDWWSQCFFTEQDLKSQAHWFGFLFGGVF